MHCRQPIIFSIADLILQIAHDDPDTKPPTIGINWATNSLARNDDYRIRISKSSPPLSTPIIQWKQTEVRPTYRGRIAIK